MTQAWWRGGGHLPSAIEQVVGPTPIHPPCSRLQAVGAQDADGTHAPGTAAAQPHTSALCRGGRWCRLALRPTCPAVPELVVCVGVADVGGCAGAWGSSVSPLGVGCYCRAGHLAIALRSGLLLQGWALGNSPRKQAARARPLAGCSPSTCPGRPRSRPLARLHGSTAWVVMGGQHLPVRWCNASRGRGQSGNRRERAAAEAGLRGAGAVAGWRQPHSHLLVLPSWKAIGDSACGVRRVCRGC